MAKFVQTNHEKFVNLELVEACYRNSDGWLTLECRNRIYTVDHELEESVLLEVSETVKNEK